jgi:hypothetical protein
MSRSRSNATCPGVTTDTSRISPIAEGVATVRISTAAAERVGLSDSNARLDRRGELSGHRKGKLRARRRGTSSKGADDTRRARTLTLCPSWRSSPARTGPSVPLRGAHSLKTTRSSEATQRRPPDATMSVAVAPTITTARCALPPSFCAATSPDEVAHHNHPFASARAMDRGAANCSSSCESSAKRKRAPCPPPTSEPLAPTQTCWPTVNVPDAVEASMVTVEGSPPAAFR